MQVEVVVLLAELLALAVLEVVAVEHSAQVGQPQHLEPPIQVVAEAVLTELKLHLPAQAVPA
jgi:hypothetical protein